MPDQDERVGDTVWVLIERNPKGKERIEGVALSRDVGSEFVRRNEIYGYARSSLPFKVIRRGNIP